MVKWRHVPNLGLAFSLACSDGTGLVLRNEQPMFYLVLSRPSVGSAPSQPLAALLATTGTPVKAEYRDADSFIVRRVRDGRLLAWSSRGLSGGIDTDPRAIIEAPGNYVLAREDSGALLGRAGLTGGDVYRLDASTKGVSIHGEVVLPEDLRPTIDVSRGQVVVRWNRARGAAAYLVTATTERAGTVMTADTAMLLRFDAPDPNQPATPILRIIALDENYRRFITDTTVRSAGLVNALGLFGAISVAETTYQRPKSAVPQRDPNDLPWWSARLTKLIPCPTTNDHCWAPAPICHQTFRPGGKSCNTKG